MDFLKMLTEERDRISAAINALQGDSADTRGNGSVKKQWTPEMRAAASERFKQMWKEKKKTARK